MVSAPDAALGRGWPPGPGEMARLIRGHDWAATPLGPHDAWSERLKGAVEQMLASPLVATLACGPERVLLYNDMAAPLYGDYHPGALGRPLAETWPEGFATVAQFYHRAFAGESIQIAARPLDVSREGGEVFDVVLTPVGDGQGGVTAVCMTGYEVSARLAAEAALRAGEARQSYLLRLSDALRSLVDPAEIERAAMRLLVEELNLSRAFFFRAEREDGHWTHVVDSVVGRVPGQAGLVGRHSLRNFGSALFEGSERGKVVAVSDVAAEPRVPGAEIAAYLDLGVAAFVNVPLVRAGQYVAGICVHDDAPRNWSPDEIALIREVSARTWEAVERARAAAVLRAGEERQAFQLRLSDSLRALDDPAAIQAEACRLLGDHLNVARAHYVELDATAGIARVGRDHVRDGAASLAGEHRISDFVWSVELLLRDGLVVADTGTSSLVPDRDKAAAAALGIIACMGAPLMKNGRLVAALCVTDQQPREWTGAEAATLHDAAERTWAAVERARAEEALRESEARYRQLFATMDEGYALADVIFDADGRPVDILYLEANPAAERMSWKDVAGRTMRELAPDFEPYWFEAHGRVAVTGQPERLEFYATPLGRWYELSIFKPQLHDGHNRRVAVLFQDITERRNAEDAVRKSEVRFRALATSGAVTVYRMSPDWRFMYELDSTDFLAPVSSPVADWRDRFILPADQAMVDEAIAKAIRTRSMFDLEHRVALEHGGVGWVRSRAVPMLGPDGEIVEWFGVASDVTAFRAAQARLSETEARLLAFGEASSDVLWIREAETLQFTYVSPAFSPTYGIALDDVLDGDTLRNWLDLILPEDRDHARTALERVRRGERLTFEFRIRRPSDGQVRVMRNTDFPMRDAEGRVTSIAGVGHDATEMKDAEDRMSVLVAELQHRTRNLMGVVFSVTDRTLAGSASLSQFGERIRDRLGALARVNAMLSRLEEGSRLAIDELVRSELQAHGVLDGSDQTQKVRLHGPKGIRLRSSTVQTLALGVHELATNALKYGALAQPDGKLQVSWSLLDDRAGPLRLRLDWRESGVRVPVPADAGGDDVAVASRQGYGRELIERALPYQLNAEVTYDLTPDGVRCSITLPLSTTMVDGAAAATQRRG